MLFQIGNSYSRHEISKVLGGNHRWCLPRKGNKVLYGAFTSEISPNAPWEILIGDKKKILESAEILIQQNEPIPIFLKQENKNWQYCGLFRLLKYSRELADISEQEKKSGKTRLQAVLFFETVN
ncbi:MAG: hypothetical protein KME23_15675 [Goleter apudmare HA4340-LM2]|jgi:hypothetical protein|nr:hypothetical protein [Goleter apudmare HA4340-LM2]